METTTTWMATNSSIWYSTGSSEECESSAEESSSLSYHPALQIALETLCFGGVVTGILANNLVIWIILSNSSLRGRTNWYILNLCVANCLVVLSTLPLNIVHLSGTCEAARLLFTSKSCALIVYLSETMPDVSMITLTLMVIERYFAFVHPLLAIRINSAISLRARITISWLLPSATFFPKLFFHYEALVTTIITPHNNITQVRCHEVQSAAAAYQFYAASVDSWAYILAAIVIAAANARIAIILQRRWRVFGERRHSNCFKEQNLMHDEETRKVTRMLSCVSAVYVIAWIPVSIHHFLIESDITPLSYHSNAHLLLDCLFLSSLALSPIMLLIMCKRFRGVFCAEFAKIKRIIPVVRRRYTATANSRSTSTVHAHCVERALPNCSASEAL